MKRPALELYMITRYWVVAKYAPLEEFNESDLIAMDKLAAEIGKKSAEVRRHILRKKAICDDIEGTTPRMSICSRCPALSATFAGSGYMCGVSYKAVLDSAEVDQKTECLARVKINPLGGSSGI